MAGARAEPVTAGTRRGVYIDIAVNAALALILVIALIHRPGPPYLPGDAAAAVYAAARGLVPGDQPLPVFIESIRAPSLWVLDAALFAMAVLAALASSLRAARGDMFLPYIPGLVSQAAFGAALVSAASSLVILVYVYPRWSGSAGYMDYVWLLNWLALLAAYAFLAARAVPAIEERLLPPMIIEVSVEPLARGEGRPRPLPPVIGGRATVPLNHYLVVRRHGPVSDRITIRVKPKSLWRVTMRETGDVELHPVSRYPKSLLRIYYEYTEERRRVIREYVVEAEGVGEATIEFACRVNRPTVHGVVEEYYDVYVTVPVTARFREAVEEVVKELGLPRDRVEVLKATVLLEGAEIEVDPDEQIVALGESGGLVSYIDILIRAE